MKFSKMHGLGNDYVYVNGFEESVKDPSEVSVLISDRRFGIGSDGLIIILPSDIADCRMRMFNADGSEGMMCGNGIRCVGKYAYEHGIVDKTDITVETKSGVRSLKLDVSDGKVKSVCVDMGKAILKPSDIPISADGDSFISMPLEVCGKTYTVTCVSMGNPHCVVFTENDPMELDLEKIGPDFENHRLFPEKINTEFVRVIDRKTLEMRVWERGSGETFACGTGACAAAVAAAENGFCSRGQEIAVKLRGGELKIIYAPDGNVTMTGTASHVYDGTADIEAMRNNA